MKVCRSPNHAKILKIAFKFLRDRFLSKGLYIDDFPEHVGLTEDFLAYANSNNFPLQKLNILRGHKNMKKEIMLKIDDDD